MHGVVIRFANNLHRAEQLIVNNFDGITETIASKLTGTTALEEQSHPHDSIVRGLSGLLPPGYIYSYESFVHTRNDCYEY